MDRAHPPMTESKLLVLYAMRYMRHPASGMEWIQFFLENDLMEYMDAKLAIEELADGRAIVQGYERDGESIYVMTKLGRDMLDLFYKRIPASRREAMKKAVIAWRNALRAQRAHMADYAKRFDGEYDVRLRLRERGDTMYSIYVRAVTQKQAKNMVRNWREACPEIVRTITRTLNRGDFTPVDEAFAMQADRERAMELEDAQEEAAALAMRRAAKRMLEDGIDEEHAALYTGLPIEQVQAVRHLAFFEAHAGNGSQ